MCALTFARRFLYNTSELPRDGASAVADQMRWIYGLLVQSVRIFGSFSRRSGNDPEQARFNFRRLCELALGLSPQPINTISLKELLMGVSNDDHIAVEERAMMVRLGVAIFGVWCV